MQTFSSGREAKEYIVSKIVEEANLEGVPLSETERKMLYFSETFWSLPDILEVNADFEREYDDSEYEAKIGELARNFRTRAGRESEVELATWKEAVRILEREDHYLLVLIHAKETPLDSPLSDQLKLIATAIVLVIVVFATMYVFSHR